MANATSLELGAGCLRWAPTSGGGAQLPKADHLKNCVPTNVRGKPQLQQRWGNSEMFWQQLACGHQKHALWPAAHPPDSISGRLPPRQDPVRGTFRVGREDPAKSACTVELCILANDMTQLKNNVGSFAIRRFERKAAYGLQENETAWLLDIAARQVWVHGTHAIWQTHICD